MSQTPATDYIFIVLIAAGVAVLGAEELRREHDLGSWKSGFEERDTGERELIAESREDLSSEFASGAKAEELRAKTEESKRARYSWKDKEKVTRGVEKVKQKSFVRKLSDSLLGEPPPENK